MEEFDEIKAKKLLEMGYRKAKEILNNKEEVENLLIDVENKMKTIEIKDSNFEKVQDMISLVKSYINKSYTNITTENIIVIISAFLYLVAPVDAIPDSAPQIGYSDDAAVIKFALKLVDKDL